MGTSTGLGRADALHLAQPGAKLVLTTAAAKRASKVRQPWTTWDMKLARLEVWHLAVASFVNGIGWAADNPVRRMMIGNAVGPQSMGSAISLDVASSNASRVIGPLLAGVLLASFSIASVYWFSLLLYAASLAAACRINALDVTTPAHPTSFFTGVRQGFAWLRGDRDVIGVFVVTVICNIFGSPYASMVPVIFTDYFHLDPQGVGLLASFEGVGGLLGAVVFVSLAPSEWYGRICLCATAAYFVMMIGFAAAPDAWVAAVFLLLLGISGVGFSVMQATLIYRDSPVEMRGRLLGVLSVCIGTGPIGLLYLGFLAEALTPRGATLALAVQGIAALLLTRRYWAGIARQ